MSETEALGNLIHLKHQQGVGQSLAFSGVHMPKDNGEWKFQQPWPEISQGLKIAKGSTCLGMKVGIVPRGKKPRQVGLITSRSVSAVKTAACYINLYL